MRSDEPAVVTDDAAAGEVEPCGCEPGGRQRDRHRLAVVGDLQRLRPQPAEVDARVDVAGGHHHRPLAGDEGREVLRVVLDVDDLLEVRARRAVLVQALQRVQQRGLRAVARLGRERVELAEQRRRGERQHGHRDHARRGELQHPCQRLRHGDQGSAGRACTSDPGRQPSAACSAFPSASRACSSASSGAITSSSATARTRASSARRARAAGDDRRAG